MDYPLKEGSIHGFENDKKRNSERVQEYDLTTQTACKGPQNTQIKRCPWSLGNSPRSKQRYYSKQVLPSNKGTFLVNVCLDLH